MPKRRANRFRYESVLEGQRLSPGRERKLWTVPIARSAGDLARWHSASDDMERFYAAPNAAMAAYHLGNLPLACEIAQAGLQLAEANRSNWNFGNAIHFCHAAQGLVALK